MTACGAAPVYTQELDSDPLSAAGQQEAQNAMLQVIQNDGTTILCLCEQQFISDGLMHAADSQHRFPEWVMNNYGDQDREDKIALTAPEDQIIHLFGVSWYNKV